MGMGLRCVFFIFAFTYEIKKMDKDTLNLDVYNTVVDNEY